MWHRTTLDAQSRETERLQRELRGDSSVSTTTSRGRYGNLLSSLDITPPPVPSSSTPSSHQRHTSSSASYMGPLATSANTPYSVDLASQWVDIQNILLHTATIITQAVFCSQYLLLYCLDLLLSFLYSVEHYWKLDHNKHFTRMFMNICNLTN